MAECVASIFLSGNEPRVKFQEVKGENSVFLQS